MLFLNGSGSTLATVAPLLAVLAKSFVELHTLPAEPDMSKLYTEAFLPAKSP